MTSLGSLFSRQAAPLIGLDISSSSVKLVELGRDRDGTLVLERCAIEPLERGWITDGNVEKFDEVAEAMRRVIKRSGTRTRNVAMALPASAVITKKIILPGGLSDSELEIQVETEANQYIPFSLDEVSLDFCVVGPSSSSSGDVEVLIAASRKEKVQDRQGLAEAAGLKPVIIDVESYASRLAAGRLINELPAGGKDQLVALFAAERVAAVRELAGVAGHVPAAPPFFDRRRVSHRRVAEPWQRLPVSRRRNAAGQKARHAERRERRLRVRPLEAEILAQLGVRVADPVLVVLGREADL